MSDDKENVQPAYNYFPYPSGADVGRDATLPSSSFESGRASLGSTGAEAEAEAKEVLPETDEQKEMRRRD